MDPATDDLELWRRYQREQAPPLRDALVRRYESLVRIHAARAYAQRYSPELEFNDYLQFGMVGLLESIDRYRVGAGAKFETFASHRVSGAILDGVESLSEKQRQIAARRQAIKARAASLKAAGLEGALRHVFDRLGDTAVGLALGLLLEGSGACFEESATSSDNSYAGLELRQLQTQVHTAMATVLNEQQHAVVKRHYFQQQTFEEISEGLKISRSRVSQIHGAALRRLRETWV